MNYSWMLTPPTFVPPLDPDFRPAVLANRTFDKAVADSGRGVPLILGLERNGGAIARFETKIFPAGHDLADASCFYIERILKFLLWQKGAFRVHVGGPGYVAAYLAGVYRPGGARAFDFGFMGKSVYEQTFQIRGCKPEEVPAENESTQPLGRHLDGCRIGFDLGASDRKVSAVVDGEAIFSE